jgi:hypothetical protein
MVLIQILQEFTRISHEEVTRIEFKLQPPIRKPQNILIMEKYPQNIP